jgi:NAD(P)-dependent dehydrogenase (short-subunit alcohol dehydrogenase family)
MAGKRTAIVTGASQGIGAAVVQAFLDRGYNVIATSRGISKANFAPSPHIGQAATADNVAQTAISKFGSINHVVNNAGILVFYRLQHRRVSSFRLHQPGRIHLHNPTRCQANAVTGYGRQRDKHHDVVSR